MSWPIEMRYTGAIGLLCECSPYLGFGSEKKTLRESIERAVQDFCDATPGWSWRRVLDRIELVAPQGG